MIKAWERSRSNYGHKNILIFLGLGNECPWVEDNVFSMNLASWFTHPIEVGILVLRGTVGCNWQEFHQIHKKYTTVNDLHGGNNMSDTCHTLTLYVFFLALYSNDSCT